MSNKTTFKRVALAVVGALGLGVLSVSPASAAITTLLVTPGNGTATTATSDSSTAGTLSISYIETEALDSVAVTTYVSSAPTAAALAAVKTNHVRLVPVDSVGSTMNVTMTAGGGALTYNANGGSATGVNADSSVVVTGAGTTGSVGVKFKVYIDTAAAGVALAIPSLTAGTYALTSIVTPYSNGIAGTNVTAVSNIVVSALASASTTVDSTKSIAQLSDGSMGYSATTTTPDSAISKIATAAATDHATILVRTFNASGNAAPESVTATITGAGILQSGGVSGASLTLNGATGIETITVRANGTAGVAKIDIKTTSKTFPTKSVTFFATAPATVVPTLDIPVIGIGATSDVIVVDAKDANTNVWGGTAYLFSSDTTVATAGTCTFVAADAVHYCAVTGVKAGTAKFQIGNASTLALSTVKTAEFDGPVVNPNPAATVGISFDKAAYAPGEKARIYVTPLDVNGKAVAGGTSTALLATGGISSSVAFSSGSDTTTAVNLEVASASSATTGAKAGSAVYTVYMPFGKGTVTLTAKGGTGLPAAGRVAVTASASIVDDSVDAAVDAAQEATDAAIAATDAAILAQEAADEAASAAIAAQETAQAAVDAVTALSAEVTKLVAQLATLQKLLTRVAKKVGLKI